MSSHCTDILGYGNGLSKVASMRLLPAIVVRSVFMTGSLLQNYTMILNVEVSKVFKEW